MLRRAALLVCLLLPVAAAGQAAGAINVSPKSTFGVSDCSTPLDLSLTWNVGTVSTATTNSVYEISAASSSSDCSSTNSIIVKDIAFTSAIQTFPGVGDTAITTTELRDSSFLTCDTSDHTVYFCVKLLQDPGSSTVLGTASTNVLFQLGSPAAPTNVVVKPADSGLWVYWSAGSGSVAAATYKISAVNAISDPGTHEATGITDTSYRLGGLINGVTYGVTVTAYSSGGNASAPSATVDGTPEPVDGFWEIYKGAGGREDGGCGGPAGAASLLGLAAVLGALRMRRRS